MAAPTPALETVLAAIKTAMEAIASIGTVRVFDHTLEDDVEFLDEIGLLDADSMDLWIVELEGVSPEEGSAPGEIYEIYNLRIRYWSIRTGDEEWSKGARQKAASVCDALSGNAAVFRIGGQVQLRTPETVAIDSHGPTSIQGPEGGQLVYQTMLSLSVEARRWL